MKINRTGEIARRTFLQRMGQLGLAGVATPWAVNLAAISEAAADTAQSNSDYKALVCIFLYGGNDNGNTVIPYDATGHADYTTVRGAVAIPRDDLAGTQLAPTLDGGRQYALAPTLSALKPLFDDGTLAVQLNVGPLIQPTTLDQYKKRSVPLPPKLFSHNDQQSVWQSSQAEGAVRGWGGTLGDLALSGNGRQLFTCVSVTGNAVFLSGEQALSYQIGTGGPVAIKSATTNLYGSAACSAALRQLITEERGQILEYEYNRTTVRALESYDALTGAIAGNATSFDADLPDKDAAASSLPLNRQLKMVARLIDAQSRLGMKRQVFLVSLGGFDNHDNLNTRHREQLRQLAVGMSGFRQAMKSIGLDRNVTTFTASEFGRTMKSNGDGSDHGWGSTHFVTGGAVNGGKFYGTPPQILLGGQEDTGQGRLLPSTSVAQYAATMASWFGVSNSDLALVAPEIVNFSTRNLGFV